MPTHDRTPFTVPLRDGLELRGEVVRNGAPTLIVPAGSWVAADMDPLVEGRTVVFYDIRGRGRSDAVHDLADLALEHDVEDLERLRTALDLERFSILGWSYHAAIAAHYALAHPERVERLVLVASIGPRMHPWFWGYIEGFARRCDPEKLRQIGTLRREGCGSSDPHRWCRTVLELYLRAYVADAQHIERMKSSPCVEPNLDAERVNEQGRLVVEKLGEYDWRTDLEALDKPTLLLHGRADPVPFGGSEEWLAHLPDAGLLALDDIGHLPWLEAPELFFSSVEGFLQGTWPRAIERAP